MKKSIKRKEVKKKENPIEKPDVQKRVYKASEIVWLDPLDNIRRDGKASKRLK